MDVLFVMIVLVAIFVCPPLFFVLIAMLPLLIIYILFKAAFGR